MLLRTTRTTALGLALALGVALTPARARADEAPASAAPPDTVVLRSGAEHRGTLTEIVPGDHVTIEVEGGEPKTFAWSEIDRVVAGAPAQAPAASPPAPPAETPAHIDTPPPPVPPPRREWRANRPLLVAGAVTFFAGYAPAVATAVPSTVSLGGRVLLFVGTLGLLIAVCGIDTGGDGWLCHAQHGGMQLLIPVAGPFIYAFDHPRDSILNKTGARHGTASKALLFTSGGLQVAGVGLILGALAAGKRELVSSPTKSTSPSWFVHPQLGANQAGLTFGVHRW